MQLSTFQTFPRDKQGQKFPLNVFNTYICAVKRNANIQCSKGVLKVDSWINVAVLVLKYVSAKSCNIFEVTLQGSKVKRVRSYHGYSISNIIALVCIFNLFL